MDNTIWSHLAEENYFSDKIYPANAIGILKKWCYNRMHTFPDGTVVEVLLFPFWTWDNELKMFDKTVLSVHISYILHNHQRLSQTRHWYLEKDGSITELEPQRGYRKSNTIPMALIRSIVTDTPIDGSSLLKNVEDMDDIRYCTHVWYDPRVGWNAVLMDTSRRIAQSLTWNN